MRSSKSRSRGKSRSNNRSPSNNLNRVFDSSGPEGKVRGTPQQIIDKYAQLARDAFLGNDRVAAENFQQHAEHYTRLLAEAQRDAEDKRAQADQQNRERQQQRQRERDDRDRSREDAGPAPTSDIGSGDQPEVIEATGAVDAGLVETPEAQPKPKKRAPRARKPRPPKPQATEAGGEAPTDDKGTTEAAE